MGQIDLGKVTGAQGPKGKNVFIKYNTVPSDTGATATWTNGQNYIGVLTADGETAPLYGYTWSLFAHPGLETPIPVSQGGTGKTSITANNILVGNGTYAPTERAITTSITSGGTRIPTEGAVANYVSSNNMGKDLYTGSSAYNILIPMSESLALPIPKKIIAACWGPSQTFKAYLSDTISGTERPLFSGSNCLTAEFMLCSNVNTFWCGYYSCEGLRFTSNVSTAAPEKDCADFTCPKYLRIAPQNGATVTIKQVF